MRDYNKEFETLLDMTLELLAVLDSDSEWGMAEEDKLKRLTKIAGLIDKVKKIIGTPHGAAISLDEDEQIIQRFLTRINARTDTDLIEE